MADRRRLVTIAPGGSVTTVKDLENSTAFFSVRGSFQVIPPARQQVIARRQRRYGGGRVVAETHDNGAVTWKALVAGTSADDAIANAEAMLTELERARTDLFYEWRPDGATTSVYYEIRGPATWQPTYEWAQFTGAKSMYFDVSIPVAPLAQLAKITISPSALDLPAVIALGTTIPGDAPALADVKLRTSGDSVAPVFALIGWTRRPGSPLSTSVVPFGIIEAETGVDLSLWSVASSAAYRGSSFLAGSGSGSGTASASFRVDPSTLDPDDFAQGETAVEVWARIALDASMVSPKLTLSMVPDAGTSFGQEQFTAEHGTRGKLLAVPSSGNPTMFTRLGTLMMPVNPAAPLKYKMKVAAAWGPGSSGIFNLDYLICVPARCRALSPTGKPRDDGTYPKFIISTSDTAKTIRGGDLSGQVASGSATAGRDSGLGGSPIELPPGDVDMLIKLSSLVPDDPAPTNENEILKHASVVPTITVTPRVWLAKGT